MPIILCFRRTSVPSMSGSSSPVAWWIWAVGRADTAPLCRSGILGNGGRSVTAHAPDGECKGGGARGGADYSAVKPVPPGLFPRRVLRLRPVDVQHVGDDPQPQVAASRFGVKPGESCGRAGEWRFTFIISGSTCAIPRGGAGFFPRRGPLFSIGPTSVTGG